jgi:hypothetical protein
MNFESWLYVSGTNITAPSSGFSIRCFKN